MADETQQTLRTFIEAWTAEFEKSVEMFTGIAVELENNGQSGRRESLGAQESLLWQGEIFEGDGNGSVWIGTPVETCTTLIGTLADNADGRQALYREILQQSFEGAAHVLSSGRTPRLACKQSIKNGTAPTDLAHVETAWLVTPDGKRSAVLVGIDPGFVALLRVKEEPPADVRANTRDSSQDTAPMNRLGDLELPISVVLGRAKLQIREVLKLTAGSLVELDRRVGELVELVVHNAVVARGEVVSVGGNYAIRIQEVISRDDRLALQTSAAKRPTRASHHSTVN